MNKIGIAIWGLGKHAQNRILPALSSLPQFSLIGVCSRTEKKVFNCSQQWNCLGWTDPIDMLKNNNVDIVYIATPIGIHFNLAIQSLKAGKHVWCEKPLTCNYNETQILVHLAKKNKLMLTESFMYLYHPQFKKIQNIVNYSKTGKVHSIICRFGIPTLEDPGFRQDPNLGGGALWDVGSYTVSAIHALFPDKNVKVLFAEIIKKINFQVDTNGRALLRFSNGPIAYLEWGINLGYKNEIDLWFDEGSFFTDKIFSKPKDYRPIYKIHDQNGNKTFKYGNKSEQFTKMFENFYNMLKSPSKIEAEYLKIIQRAQIMDEIVKYSNSKK